MESLERCLQTKLKLIVCLVFVLSIFAIVSAQSEEELIRFPLWAQLEAYPGTREAASASDNVFSYPISRLKAAAPFFMEGMVCGWSFSYTPSDKMRNVAEYFEFTPLYDLSSLGRPILYKEPWIQDGRLYCWVEYLCSPQTADWRRTWNVSGSRRISGTGQGLLVDGFDGITVAAKEALKSAVRNYARSITKNKPREITGEVLIADEPVIGIRSGRYIVELDFFLNIGKIWWYNIY